MYTNYSLHLQPGMWERIIRQSFLLPHISFPPLPLPLTKNEKTTVDKFFKLFYHLEDTKTYPYNAITLRTVLRLSLLFRTTLSLFVFLFLDIRTRIEYKTVLFKLFVIAEPPMCFRVCHGIPTNKSLEITSCW